MTISNDGPAGLLLSDDLIFASRVISCARAHGLGVVQARTTANLIAIAESHAPRCVLVDLQNPGLDLPQLLEKLRDICPSLPRVVGYGSHVEAAVLRAAREAGCDPVLPRSRFVEVLEESLPGWLGRSEPKA
jgi:CheY-like chemotaxis protein